MRCNDAFCRKYDRETIKEYLNKNENELLFEDEKYKDNPIYEMARKVVEDYTQIQNNSVKRR